MREVYRAYKVDGYTNAREIYEREKKRERGNMYVFVLREGVEWRLSKGAVVVVNRTSDLSDGVRIIPRVLLRSIYENGACANSSVISNHHWGGGDHSMMVQI